MKVKSNLEFKFIISLIFAVLVSIFAIQNAGNVEIRFFFGQFVVSQAVVILGSAIIGAIIVVLLGLIKQIRQNKKIKQLSKELELIRNERNELQAKLDSMIIAKAEEENEIVVENVIEEAIKDEGDN